VAGKHDESHYYVPITHHQTASQLFQKADLLPKQLTGTKKPSHFENAGASFLVPKIAK
jgi:hypothetical protein